MPQPKDYPDGTQIIIENGRLDSLFKALTTIAIMIVGAYIIWSSATLYSLDKQFAVIVSQQAEQNRRVENLEGKH